VVIVEAHYRNKNRGYQQLRVWQDATELYALTSRIFRPWTYELKRVVSQAIASADSVHRNIAEGYCRRSIREYLYHLNVSLGSLGESVSGFMAYRQAGQLAEADFAALNNLSFKLENGLLKLVESLERKQADGDWIDHLMLKESNDAAPSNTPTLHHSTTPSSP
jgi:four helix bundle protein